MRFEIEKIKMKFSKDYFWILHKISLSKIVIHNTRTYFQSEILILENSITRRKWQKMDIF